MSILKCENWFPVPIWFSVLPTITDDDNQKAILFCKKKQEESQGRVISNVGGWQSEDLYFDDIKGTPLEKYMSYIEGLVSGCLIDLGMDGNFFIANTWININNTSNKNNLHTHPRAVLSGCFYLTDDNSNLVFQRPVGIDTYFLETYKSKNNTYLSHTNVSYSPSSRNVYLFPGWLPHSVEENTSNKERISVAFNVELGN